MSVSSEQKYSKGHLVTIVGNRPQFIKMSTVSRELARRGLKEIVVHTGQHYDKKMNEIFFDELSIRRPDIQLSVENKTHGAMTGELLTKIEKELLELEPCGVLIYGDTNSSLAASLAAVKLGIKIAHVESGPRLGDLNTPEEVNRIVADHVSTLRFACDRPSISNLAREGITGGVIYTGDVMYDAFLANADMTTTPSANGQIYITLHRPQNVDDRSCHLDIIAFIRAVASDVIFPLHPRTASRIEAFGLMDEYRALPNLRLSEPLGYVDSIKAVTSSDFVITDSGGLQKEAYFARKPAMLMLPQSPWPELLESDWLVLGGWVNEGRMLERFKALKEAPKPATAPDFFGTGNAAAVIVDALVEHGFVRRA